MDIMAIASAIAKKVEHDGSVMFIYGSCGTPLTDSQKEEIKSELERMGISTTRLSEKADWFGATPDYPFYPDATLILFQGQRQKKWLAATLNH